MDFFLFFDKVVNGVRQGGREDSRVSGGLESAEINVDYSPAFLNGELEVARASNVCLYVAQKIKAQSKKKKNTPSNRKLVGLLVITNFRLCFIPFDDEHKDDKKKSVSHQENNFLAKFDITLSNMDEIYAYTDKKYKLVAPQQKNEKRIDAIRIVCKNFRMLTFDFTENCQVGKGKNVADALLKFAFPTRHNLLFMYHFRESYYNASRSFRTYQDDNDWYHELERCGFSSREDGAWRVVQRKELSAKDALPRCFVVPKVVSDEKYFELCEAFRCNRAAVWVWGIGKASLIRMADVKQEILNNPKEISKDNLMIEYIRMSAGREHIPQCIELTKGLPSIQDVQQSYVRLRILCSPISDRELMTQDEKFFTQLEKSCWLLYVSLCLKTANECADHLLRDNPVVLQENEGRDMSCVISSLIQVLLDPFYRTINGFQVLIQKEWIALGHPFADRMGHVYNKTTEKSPLFLLFLDCTWQALQQFPDAFEFSETFLSTIWDSVFIPIFDTFQFNSEYDRQRAVTDEHLVLRSVFDWGEMLNDRDVALFTNPLYKKPVLTEQEIEHNRKSKLPPTALKLPGLDLLGVRANPRQRPMSLQPVSKAATKGVDTDAKLLLPSQLLNSHHTIELPKIEEKMAKVNVANNEQPQQKYLKPSHFIWDLEIFSQCYYRFMPILEIKQGGSVQIDLFNRMLLSDMLKSQKALETRNEHDIEIARGHLVNRSLSESDEAANGDTSSCLRQKVPVVNSFFPFSYTDMNDEDHSILNDILISSSIQVAEGSILDLE